MTAYELQQRYRKRLQDQKDDRAAYTFGAIVLVTLLLTELWKYCAWIARGG